MVTPWVDNLALSDAFRGPLAESFKLVEIIRNYQLNNKYLIEKYPRNQSVNNITFHFLLEFP